MNVNEMTLDEVRDALAGADGWNTYNEGVPDDGARHVSWWRYTLDAVHGGRTWCKSHPHPATLDGAAAALPEGWTWWKVTAEWAAQAAHSPMIYIPDTGDEIADRYRLALACRLAEKGDKQ